jgi:predicted RNase H-like nuclease (RuvC/YqgF family)
VWGGGPNNRKNEPMITNTLHHPTMKDGDGNPLLDMRKLEPIIADMAIRTSKQIPETMSTLVEQTIEARQSLSQACEGIGENVEKLKPLKKEMIDELRGLRMTTTTEVAAMLKPLEDIRKFFLGAEHEKEVERLREFVDLCERLEKLKASGFLDTVADTMLKLS